METMESGELTQAQRKYLPWKRAVDVVLSGGAILALSPVLGAIALAIKLDSPGPVLFKQKRVGKDKKLFEIWKFRSMRTDTPKDIPTHMLGNPDAFITKTGRFLRKTSLDELPQLFNIFKGEMSIIGPRPALWNQDDLIAQRDLYGANDVTPGLTGWAQINGRDELEIPVKARFDGEYVEKMGPKMDVKCFLGTIGSVLSHEGVVEGGTGQTHKTGYTITQEKLNQQIHTGAAVLAGAVGTAGVGIYCCVKKKKLVGAALLGAVGVTAYTNWKRRKAQPSEKAAVIPNMSKGKRKVLITGANSYIGTSVAGWLGKEPDIYQVDTLDMLDAGWRDYDFSQYDTVFHVAGIAHADVGNVSEERKKLYYQVNRDLAVEVAQKAKESGVKQFIFMSSMIVYSGCKDPHITADTQPKPLNFYGDSKWQADQAVRAMADGQFRVVVLRPPMIYGKGSKGNYPQLAALAAKTPVFPIVKNRRSMLHIDNLCQFVKYMIDNEESGVFFPQNGEYVNTSDLVELIAKEKGHRIVMLPMTGGLVKLMEKMPGKIGALATKAFGDSTYDMAMSQYPQNYRVHSLRQSIHVTEGEEVCTEC